MTILVPIHHRARGISNLRKHISPRPGSEIHTPTSAFSCLTLYCRRKSREQFSIGIKRGSPWTALLALASQRSTFGFSYGFEKERIP